MKQDILQTAKIIALGAILALGVSFAHAVWVGPTAPPPLNNASAPLNVGTSAQVKAGGIGATTFLGDEYCLGVDCITAWPGAGVGILSGSITNGGIIPLPSGYTQGQCNWIVSPADMHNPRAGSNETMYSFKSLANSNRQVTCTSKHLPGTFGGTCSYLIICSN